MINTISANASITYSKQYPYSYYLEQIIKDVTQLEIFEEKWNINFNLNLHQLDNSDHMLEILIEHHAFKELSDLHNFHDKLIKLLNKLKSNDLTFNIRLET
jgi:hypothetical protein